MFIQTEATPNPATLKFLPGRSVMGEGTLEMRDAASAAAASPLAGALFAIPGVEGVFFGSDFITVTRGEAEWAHLKPAILGAIMEHFTSGAPVLFAAGGADDAHAEHDGEDGEIVSQIKELLDTRVRPAVAQDGGDITFQGYEQGVVFLNMQGACAGCPSSTITLKRGVENMLKHYIPEIVEVRQI